MLRGTTRQSPFSFRHPQQPGRRASDPAKACLHNTSSHLAAAQVAGGRAVLEASPAASPSPPASGLAAALNAFGNDLYNAVLAKVGRWDPLGHHRAKSACLSREP